MTAHRECFEAAAREVVKRAEALKPESMAGLALDGMAARLEKQARDLPVVDNAREFELAIKYVSRKLGRILEDLAKDPVMERGPKELRAALPEIVARICREVTEGWHRRYAE